MRPPAARLLLCALALSGCVGQAPRSGDLALRDEVLALPPTDVPGAIERVKRMNDMVERGVTVELWIRQNRGRVDMHEALQLCRLISTSELEACTRHLHALHLNRPGTE